MKPIVPRRRADQDANETLDDYVAESSEETGLRFIDALESAYGNIGRYPGIGSLRYAYELALPGLRSWRLKGFPYLVFYIERDGYIDVWRVLHERRDISRWLRDTGEASGDTGSGDSSA